MNTRGGAWKRLIELYDEKAIKALKKDPFKDLKFINKVSKGEVQGLSKEALDAMQGVKTVKEAMQKAKSAGVEDEIRRVYPLEGSRFDLSKNKKGFVQVGKVDDNTGVKSNTSKDIKV